MREGGRRFVEQVHGDRRPTLLGARDPHAHGGGMADLRRAGSLDAGDRAVHAARLPDRDRVHRNAERARRRHRILARVHRAVAHHHDAVRALAFGRARELRQRIADRGRRAAGSGAQPRRERHGIDRRPPAPRAHQLAHRAIRLLRARHTPRPRRQRHAARSIHERDDAHPTPARALEHGLRKQRKEQQQRERPQPRHQAFGPLRQRRNREPIRL